MNIAHFRKRAVEELRATLEIGRKIGVIPAIDSLAGKVAIQRMCRNGYLESEYTQRVLRRKHDAMLRYFSVRYGDEVLRRGRALERTSLPRETVPGEDDRPTIWVCWWQGIELAPDIVKACVESVRLHSPGWKLVVVDESNYRDLVDLPEWVVTKFSDGIIGRTNYSDLLRFALLAQHGGLWLDSTVYCAIDLPAEISGFPLFTIRRPDCDHMSVAGGQFSDFAIGCNWEHRWVFEYFRDVFLEYWRTNDYLVDYLTNDYLIVLIQHLDAGVGTLFNQVPNNNPRCGDLLGLLDQRYDVEHWRSLLSDTTLFKLSWKQTFRLKSGEAPTYYSRVLAPIASRDRCSDLSGMEYQWPSDGTSGLR